MKITRRRFLKAATTTGTGLAMGGLLRTSAGCRNVSRGTGSRRFRRCLVLGIDGLDPRLLGSLMQDNELPNFSALASRGSFAPLRTSNPAASPVAWSNIATGARPCHHGIFDFLHRDPESYLPYISLRESATGIFGTRYRKARKCDGFWRYTSDAGLPTTVIRWPVTFPAETVKGRFLSGLGVPDLLGSEGRYAYYTTEPIARDDPSPHNVVKVNWERDGVIKTFLKGPLIGRGSSAELPLVIKRLGPSSSGIDVAGAPIIEASCGEWTPWVKISFRAGWQRIYGIVKFLLVDVAPHLKLFVYPVNIDPTRQAFTLTYPAGFGRELENSVGMFHTLGMPELVHPVSHGRYSVAEFLSQVEAIAQERTAMFEKELSHFEEGVCAFVFDHTDRMQHALWMGMDTQHPVYDAAKAGFYNKLIHDMYRQMDAVVGRALEKADDNTILLVISDHGFGSFRRQVHVNRWLIENGFMYLRGSDNAEGQGLFENVDWARTRAYALGFASIYINLGGRERSGIVKPGEEYEQMCTQISASLENLADTDNGNQIVHAVYRRNRACGGVPSAGRGPDLLVGLRPGYRFSWQTALGAAPPDLIEDNTTQWCGDHIFDPSFVPGIVLSSERLSTDEPCGLDIAPTVLRCLGLTQPAFMIGKCLAEL